MPHYLYSLIALICMLPLAACNSQSEEDRYFGEKTPGKKAPLLRPKIQKWSSNVRTTLIINNASEWTKAYRQTSGDRENPAILALSEVPLPEAIAFNKQTVLIVFTGKEPASRELKIISAYDLGDKIQINVVENTCDTPEHRVITTAIPTPSDAVAIDKTAKDISFKFKQTTICPNLKKEENMEY